jgi:hypothetical protein
MRFIGWILGLGLVAFGALAAHYTTGDSPHHREWAESHGMPVPSFVIFVLGVAATVVGGICVGWLLARRRSIPR